jgi:hypothetical protein
VEQTLHKLTLALNNSEKVYECALLKKGLWVTLVDGILEVTTQESGV